MLTDFVVTVSGLLERKQSRGYATSEDDKGSAYLATLLDALSVTRAFTKRGLVEVRL